MIALFAKPTRSLILTPLGAAPLLLSAQIVGLALLASSASLPGQTLVQVDIQRDSDGSTQSGWAAWNLSGTFSGSAQAKAFASGSTTDGTLDVTLTPGSNAGARSYGLDNVTDPGNLTIPDVWNDQYFFNNNSGGSLTITLDDLMAGTYQFTSYHYSDNLDGDSGGANDEGTANVSIDTGSGALPTGSDVDFVVGTNSQVATAGAGVLASELVTFGTFTTTITVASNGDSIDIIYGSLSSGDTFGLNGFELISEAPSGPDTSPPLITALSPPDGAANVLPSISLMATFNEPIQAGSGNITLVETGVGTVATYDVTASPELTFGPDDIIIDPASDLDPATTYHVLIDSTAVTDLSSNAFAGITDSSTWNFTTGTPPSFPLQVQTTTDSSGTAHQAGWNLVDGPRNDASVSGVIDGITVTVAGEGGTIAYGRSHGADGGAYVAVDHTDGDLDNLLSGGRLTNDGQDLTLTLSGLPDGNYEIVTYHHSLFVGGSDGIYEFDILLTDANGTNALIHDDIENSFGAAVSTSNLAALFTPFTVSGGNDVTLSFSPDAGYTSGNEHMVLNGFELVSAGPDTTDPFLVDLTPPDDSEAPLSGDLVATFDDRIVPGTGFITIHESGGPVFETFAVTSSRLTFSNLLQGSLTIDPTSDFTPGTSYHVLIDATAIDDDAGNSFAGISSPTIWNFTGDGSAPTGTGSSEVSLAGLLTLSFNEDVLPGPGNIEIRKASDGSLVSTFAATASNVSINGATVTIQPGSLNPETSYYVEIDAGAFTDLSGNAFAGFSGSNDWNFTTPDTSLVGVPPPGGTSLGAAFEAWIADYPDVGTHVGPYHNPDGSRFNSFAEFAFDGNPLLRGNAEGIFPGKINAVGGDQALTLTVPVRDGAIFSGSPTLLSDPVDGVSYGLEATRDFSTWDVGVSEVTGPDATAIQASLPALSTGWSYRTFRTAGTPATEPKMYFRSFADDVPTRIEQARDSAVIAGYALGKVKRWLNEVAIPKINSNDLYVAHNGGSARYSSWWNYDDTAADCYPFLFWAAYYTDIDKINTTDGPVHDVLVAEQLHCNLNSTPGSAFGRVPTAVNPDTLVKEISSYTNTMFAASEYVKDGLIPIVEVMGTGNPWFDRMQGIIDDMWANAQVSTSYGLVPTTGTEANGEQLQALARLYTMTGDTKYLDWGERLADQYLLSGTFVPSSLRDHGCEIVGGLGLFYAVESVHRPAKAATYLAGLQYMLDEILENGTNADGIMFNSLNGSGYSDGWGYNYPAFLCHDMTVSPPRYSLGLQQTLRNLAKPVYATAWGSNIDENADSIEGGLYQINRFQVPEAIAWADQEMAAHVTKTQNPDVTTTSLWGTYKLESNGVRTVLQHALMHTRGLIARPWQLDLELGASPTANGVVVKMESASGWTGILEVDKPRYQLNMGFTQDWPRMNTMPEWFVAEPGEDYVVEDLVTGAASTYSGSALHAGLPVTLDPGVEKLLLIRK